MILAPDRQDVAAVHPVICCADIRPINPASACRTSILAYSPMQPPEGREVLWRSSRASKLASSPYDGGASVARSSAVIRRGGAIGSRVSGSKSGLRRRSPENISLAIRTANRRISLLINNGFRWEASPFASARNRWPSGLPKRTGLASSQLASRVVTRECGH